MASSEVTKSATETAPCPCGCPASDSRISSLESHHPTPDAGRPASCFGVDLAPRNRPLAPSQLIARNVSEAKASGFGARTNWLLANNIMGLDAALVLLPGSPCSPSPLCQTHLQPEFGESMTVVSEVSKVVVNAS
jgi:hypothetical protein